MCGGTARLTQMTSHVSASVNWSVLLVRMLREAREAVRQRMRRRRARLLASAKPNREWSVNTACAQFQFPELCLCRVVRTRLGA